MADVNVQALQQDRAGDRGSDENAMKERREIQKLVRTRDEHVIPQLVSKLSEYLISTNVKRSKDLLPAAVAATLGLGKLCDPAPSQTETYKTFGSENTITPERLLLYALNKGNNRLQSAAADALGRIGTRRCLDDLKEREKFDKSASVQGRCKMAIRNLTLRIKSSDISSSELEDVISHACNNAFIDVKTNDNGEINDDGKFVVIVKIQSPLQPHESKEDAQGKGTQEFGNNVRTQRVEIRILKDERTLRSGIKRDLQYLSISTVCGTAAEQSFKPALMLNATCLSPTPENEHGISPMHDYEFTQGALAVSNNKLMLIQTIPTELVTSNSLQQAIIAIANNGDELEKKLNRGRDTN
jgi:hypothetical protein